MTRSMARISHQAIVRSRWRGCGGFLAPRHGFASIHPHSRLAISNTDDSRVISRITVPGLTVVLRLSRKSATCWVVIVPIGASTGSRYDSNAARRTCSHRSPRFVGDTSSAYLRRASRSVCFSPAGLSSSISASRSCAQVTASRRVENRRLSRTPRLLICARHPCAVFWIDAMGHCMGPNWGFSWKSLDARQSNYFKAPAQAADIERIRVYTIQSFQSYGAVGESRTRTAFATTPSR